MESQPVIVVTDRGDADGQWLDAVVRRAPDGTLVVTDSGRVVAWYAPGRWIKVEFANLVQR